MGWRLLGITDYRPLDFATGELLPAVNAGDRCDYCQGEHDQLYQVHDGDTGRTLNVGPSCVAGACDGWTPSTKALERALAEVEAGRAAARELALDEEADAIAASTPSPPAGVDLRRWIRDHAGDAIRSTWASSYVEDLLARAVVRVRRAR